jgi:hypothetical protein
MGQRSSEDYAGLTTGLEMQRLHSLWRNLHMLFRADVARTAVRMVELKSTVFVAVPRLRRHCKGHDIDALHKRRKELGASFWIGIDGYTSATLEQTGTDSDCSKGTPRYYAWYEFLPEAGVTIETISVEPGDVMAASVVYNGTEFAATITDERTQETFTTSKAVASAKRDSAEWIAEDNTYVFTDFGTATCDATVGSKTATIGGFPNYHTITMVGSTPGKVASCAHRAVYGRNKLLGAVALSERPERSRCIRKFAESGSQDGELRARNGASSSAIRTQFGTWLGAVGT